MRKLAVFLRQWWLTVAGIVSGIALAVFVYTETAADWETAVAAGVVVASLGVTVTLWRMLKAAEAALREAQQKTVRAEAGWAARVAELERELDTKRLPVFRAAKRLTLHGLKLTGDDALFATYYGDSKGYWKKLWEYISALEDELAVTDYATEARFSRPLEIFRGAVKRIEQPAGLRDTPENIKEGIYAALRRIAEVVDEDEQNLRGKGLTPSEAPPPTTAD